MTPIPDGDAKRRLESHLNVGSDKPISYLPINTIENVLGIALSEYVLLIERRGNVGLVLRPDECCINSGAVYAYSEGDLAGVLRENEKLLRDHGWPIVPIEFVKRIAAEWLDMEAPLMPVIRKAFGEQA